MTERISPDRPYTIRVRGELTDALREALGPLHLSLENPKGAGGPCVLTGLFRDQAELHGALNALSELGVELVEVRQLNIHEQEDGRA